MAYQYNITITETNNIVTTINPSSLYETFKLDETLDSGLMEIPLLTRNELFRRFSRVNIQILKNSTLYCESDWIIYTPKKEIQIRGKKLKYNHVLGLLEPTKWLQKVITGTKAETQPLSGTQKTLKDVIDSILEVSPVVPYDDLESTRLVTLDPNIAIELDKITAPQFYFEKKNLWEIMMGVFSFINAFPRVIFDDEGKKVLTADYINQRHLNFTVNGLLETMDIIDYSDDSRGDDYATRVETFHENTVPNNERTRPNVYAQSITNYISFRAEDVLLSDSNLSLVLPYKIERPLSLEMSYYDGLNTYYSLDVFKYLYEINAYNVLEYKPSSANSGYGYRNTAIYWSYRKKKIEGFSETFGMLNIQTALKNIIKDALYEQYGVIYSSADYENIMFKISYIPYIETMRSVSYREDNADFVDSGIIVNQQERVNELFNLTKRQFGLIQRIGVDTIVFSKMHHDIASYNESTHPNGVLSLGDYTSDGYFVTKVELAHYRNFDIGRYELSKNWNRLSQFAQISKEFRAYEISLKNKDYNLKRDITIPYYKVEISSELNPNAITNEIFEGFMNTYKTGTFDPVITSIVTQVCWVTDSGAISGYSNGVYMPLMLLAEKNSIKLKLDFQDTKVAGLRIEDPTEDESEGVFEKAVKKLYQVNYTDDNGELEVIKISLYKNYWQINDVSGEPNHVLDARRLIAGRNPLIDYNENILVGTENGGSFVKAVLYDTETELTDDESNILAIYPENTWLYAKDTTYTYAVSLDSGLNKILVKMSKAIAFRNEPVDVLPFYKINKDRAEILGLEMSIPIAPRNTETNVFIIGDELSKENGIIANREISKTLYFWTSEFPYSKAQTDLISGTNTGLTVNNAITSNVIYVPQAIYENYDYYAIADSNGKLYLAVNQVDFDGTKTEIRTIYHNMLPFILNTQNQYEYADIDIPMILNVIADVTAQEFYVVNENVSMSLGINVDVTMLEYIINNINANVSMNLGVKAQVTMLEYIVNNINASVSFDLSVIATVYKSELYFDNVETQSSYDTALTDLCYINSYSNGIGGWEDVYDYSIGDIIRLDVGYLVKVDSAYYNNAGDQLEITVNAGDGQTNNLILAELSNSYNTRYTALTDGTLSTEFVVKVNDSLGGPYYYKSNMQSGSATDKNKYIWYEIKNRGVE